MSVQLHLPIFLVARSALLQATHLPMLPYSLAVVPASDGDEHAHARSAVLDELLHVGVVAAGAQRRAHVGGHGVASARVAAAAAGVVAAGGAGGGRGGLGGGGQRQVGAGAGGVECDAGLSGGRGVEGWEGSNR